MTLSRPGCSLLAILVALAACPGCGADASGGGSLHNLALPAGIQVLVDASKPITALSRDEAGLDLGYWYDITTPGFAARLASVGPRIVRWPGGSIADTYHWRTHTGCNGARKLSTAYNPNSTFANFMRDVVVSEHYDVAITVNYGSNETCSGGGDPSEAAAWVAYARSQGYARYTKYWTVGNEDYGNWEYDLHPSAHDPDTYAAAMSGPGGYYALMKAADPTARVGVIVGGGGAFSHWDQVVLAHAPYDFVEMHTYSQQPGQESDDYLLRQGPADLGETIATVRRELAAAGRPGTPIMLGEFNSVTYNPGKQTLSIVNALYTGMAFGEALDQGLAAAIWEFGAGGNQTCGNNDSPSLYGWQNFGGYDIVAVNARYAWNYCNGDRIVPEGAIFPSGDAFSLVSRFVAAGRQMLQVSVDLSRPDVRAYAASLKPGGYALMLFNLSATAPSTVTVAVENSSQRAFRAATLTYDKRLYDQTRHNVWPGPVAAELGPVGSKAAVDLPPWSMTLLTLRPASQPGAAD